VGVRLSGLAGIAVFVFVYTQSRKYRPEPLPGPVPGIGMTRFSFWIAAKLSSLRAGW
jgi:hypothetical protein